MLTYLLRQGHPGCCMDLCSWGGCWNVWTTIPIRNEGPSVIRVLPTILNSQTPSEISLTEDSCLARGLPSSWVATSNDYCKNPAFLSQFPFSWTLPENQLDFLLILYHCSMSAWSCSLTHPSLPQVLISP